MILVDLTWAKSNAEPEQNQVQTFHVPGLEVALITSAGGPSVMSVTVSHRDLWGWKLLCVQKANNGLGSPGMYVLCEGRGFPT